MGRIIVPARYDVNGVRRLDARVERFLQALRRVAWGHALPTVSLTGKAKLKEKKKAGLKLELERNGGTSAPLLVSYAIRGTAESGVHYQLLPGMLEIPAGKKSATLVVTPRADERIEGPETIEIQLLPGADCTPSLFSKLASVLTSADKLEQKK